MAKGDKKKKGREVTPEESGSKLKASTASTEYDPATQTDDFNIAHENELVSASVVSTSQPVAQQEPREPLCNTIIKRLV